MKVQHALGGLLAFQLLLAGGLFAHHRQQQSQLHQQSLILSFDKASVDKVELADKTTKVVLSKSGEGWSIPDYSNLPVDKEKIDDLLLTLSDLKGGWPVATTADSHDQFDVSEKKFLKTVKLFAKDKPVAELYLGTSPGLRTTHVRNAKETKVYSVGISSMDMPVANDQWFAHGLLKAKSPSEIKGKDFTLAQSGDAWKVGEVAANSGAADGLLKALTGFQVEGLQTVAPSGAATSTLTVVDEGKPWTLSFWVQGEQVTVRRSDQDKAFTIGKPTYDQLMSFDKAKLTAKAEEKATPSVGVTPTAAP